jgi:hypothetical protein
MPYKTRQQALAIAEHIGCPVGAHQTEEGWWPCRTQAAWLAHKRHLVQDRAFITNEVLKVDASLGLVLGWGIISTIKGEPYFDLQGDHIPDSAVLKATTDFMLNSRTAKEMHSGDPIGSVAFAFPLTAEIAKAFKIKCNQTGMLVAMRPTADVLAKFQSGEYTGFSIGARYKLSDVEDVADKDDSEDTDKDDELDKDDEETDKDDMEACATPAPARKDQDY